MKEKPGSGRLLRHPTRKQINPVLQLPGPAQGHCTVNMPRGIFDTIINI